MVRTVLPSLTMRNQGRTNQGTGCEAVDGSSELLEFSPRPDGRIDVRAGSVIVAVLTAEQAAEARNRLADAIVRALREAAS